MQSQQPQRRRRFLAQAGTLVLGSATGAAEVIDEPKDPLIHHIQLDRVRSGYDKKYCWVHPRAGAVPGNPPSVVMTMQELLLSGSDVFGPLHEMRTADLGKTWTGPVRHANLNRRPEPDKLEVHICDFTPAWHAKTSKLLGIGQTVRYRNNVKLEGGAQKETAYSVYDAARHAWSHWDTVHMPDRDRRFHHCGAGSAQRYDLPNGAFQHIGILSLEFHVDKLSRPLL